MFHKKKGPSAGNGRALGDCSRSHTSSPLNNQIDRPPQEPIRDELERSTICRAAGITVDVSSPVLAMCRKLIAAGDDPATPLHAYRGATLCLTVHSIGEGANLKVNGHGTGFIALDSGGTAMPARSNGRVGARPQPRGRAMSERRRLPDRRPCESFTFELDGLRFTASVGRFPDGRVGELFLNNHKSRNQSDTNARDAAILLSFALQFGADINEIRKALCRNSAGGGLGPIAQAIDILAGEQGKP